MRQGITNSLRMATALVMLSGATTVAAQDTGDAPANTIRTAVAKTPQYEMKEVSGYVYDAATKTPIDGAKVQAYGNSRYSVMTDETGKYTIKVPVFINSLYVTVPEYNDLRVSFNGSAAPAANLYSEKFASVYSSSTSITSGSKAVLNNTSAITADEEIENKLSGDIHTVNRTGMRGQGVAMFIRGLNSLNINAQPLIILDGMIMDPQLDRTSVHDGFFNNVIAGIDPEDIESIGVMKNATSMYGARGANGVVVINTKRGHSMGGRADR